MFYYYIYRDKKYHFKKNYNKYNIRYNCQK